VSTQDLDFWLSSKYEKLKTDISSPLGSLPSCSKAQSTMLIINKNIRSLASEGWMWNFEVVWLYHLFRRSRVHWTRRRVGQYGHCEYRSRRGFKCQLATKVNAIVAGQTSTNRRLPYLLSFVTWANCEPRRTISRTMHLSVFGPGIKLFTQVSFNIGPAKMPSLSWRISCAHFILALFTLIFTGTIL